jgi:hypothetical protein
MEKAAETARRSNLGISVAKKDQPRRQGSSLPEGLLSNTPIEEEENEMKRQIFTLMIALLLATGTVLLAQTANQQVPPSQQVDQSGKPETGSGPDVDVDAGRNAEDGLVDVDVDANADSDTAAQGNDPNPNVGVDTDIDTDVDTDVDVDTTTGVDTDNDNLPDTASGMPLLGLIGLLALGGAVVIKATR